MDKQDVDPARWRWLTELLPMEIISLRTLTTAMESGTVTMPGGTGGLGMISSIRQHWRLFALVTLLAEAIAVIVVVVRPQNYTSRAEVVVDSTLSAVNPEAILAGARAWLHSDEAARTVLHSLPSRAAATLAPGGARAALVRRLRSRVLVTRIAESYALEIGFTAADPHLAAAIADEFASGIVAYGRRTYPSAAEFSIVSTADPNVPEDGPVLWVTLAAGVLAGLVAGAITVAVAERRFAGLTSGIDVQSRLGLYHLGSVPQLRSILPDAESPVDAVVDAPFSGYAEAFRGILVAIRQTARPDARVFLFTSALPDEGKSTTVACLARSAALAGEKVVVVDCDSRRSGVSAALAGKRQGHGLSELLRGECSLDDALVEDARSGAWIIPATDDGVDMSLLMGGEVLAGLLDTLRARFDRVLVDSAPVLAMATTRSIMPLVDASIMIVRWRATSDRAIRAALATAPIDYALWSGAVLTQVDMRVQARYGLGDASAFYQQSSKYYR